MTYAAGSLIIDDDYNIFATGNAAGTGDNNVANINTIWGVGTLDKGWGQSTTVSAVSTGATVTATQWATLFTRLTSISNHTGATITALTNPVAGNLIDWKSSFSGDLDNQFINRNNAAGVGSTITTGGVATFSTSWSTQLTATHTITFASANAARYFFNAGGRITWAGARSGGQALTQNTAWTNLFTACGTLNWTTGTSTQTIAGTNYTGTTKTGGSGSPSVLQSGIGFYDLTTSNQQVFRQFASTYLYTANYVDINIRANAAAGSATVVTLVIDMVDAQGLPGDLADGTLTSTVTLVQPSTTFITSTWGTPTISSSITGS
jgi:hypothetical protein